VTLTGNLQWRFVLYPIKCVIVSIACLKALVNIPANCERTLQRDISASGITITSEIQV